MTIIGAARLSDALYRHGVDHAAAFQEYQAKLRPFVEELQEKAVHLGMALMFPSDDAEIAERNRTLSVGALALKLLQVHFIASMTSRTNCGLCWR